MACCKRVCEALGHSGQPGRIFATENLKKLGEWLSSAAQTLSARSACTYLGHLKSLYGYLYEARLVEEGSHSRVTTYFGTWGKRIAKIGRRRAQKPSLKARIEKDDVRAMLLTPTCAKAKQLLNQSRRCKKPFSVKEAVCVRDYLWLRLLSSNAPRTGELVNMTCSEFQEAQAIENCFVILVKAHKTASTHGAATIVADKQLYADMKYYLQRRNAQQDSSDALFLNRYGQKCSTDLVNLCLKRNWGGPTPIRASLLRGCVVQHVHRNGASADKDVLATKLAHHPSTQEAHYRGLISLETAVAGSKLVREAFAM